MTDLLRLSKKVEHTMFDELQDVGCSVRTMQIDISLFLADEGLVAVGTEETPCTDEILHSPMLESVSMS